jgi:hypothetical protein
MHASVSSGDGGGLMGNMLRRDESSSFCMKLEFAFIAGYFGLWMDSAFFSGLNPYGTSCFMLHVFRIRFSTFVLTRVHAFCYMICL